MQGLHLIRGMRAAATATHRPPALQLLKPAAAYVPQAPHSSCTPSLSRSLCRRALAQSRLLDVTACPGLPPPPLAAAPTAGSAISRGGGRGDGLGAGRRAGGRRVVAVVRAGAAGPWNFTATLTGASAAAAAQGEALMAERGGSLAQAVEAERQEEARDDSDDSCPVVVSFYKFADLGDDCESIRSAMSAQCEAHQVSGSMILAPEGVNGSISGQRHDVHAVLDWLEADARLAGLRRFEAPAGREQVARYEAHSPEGAKPFRRECVRFKLKPEIVTMGVDGINPNSRVGTYVKPKDWNNLISDPNTVVIDTRNKYETRVGKFKRAIDPETDNFREFPEWAQSMWDQFQQQQQALNREGVEHEKHRQGPHSLDQSRAPSSASLVSAPTPTPTPTATCTPTPTSTITPRVAMYCTGGIRCEKATAYMLSLGFKEVYHLDGGILNYLAQVPPEDSLWEGECFVFDQRVAVRPGLLPGTHRLCFACNDPVSEVDTKSPLWQEGVSCPHCYHRKSDEDRERARQRYHQILKWGRVGGPRRVARGSEEE